MRDEWFIRGEVPMTKAEVRAVSISKLELRPDSVLYDIGAGTGSVSIEAASQLVDGHVYAVEQKLEAVELIEANIRKFGAEGIIKIEGISVVTGTAPEALSGLPRPTHAFIGGSSGNLEGLLEVLLEKNPDIRIVINIIALETLTQTMTLLGKRGIEAEIVSMQVAKARTVGNYHLMQGQNPVYIVSFGGSHSLR
ncbi:MAG: precorrin-6Y C5,15-methyltransferase (decarboxylating) subunit CbiT [Hungatella hathewayi]|nr:precorrin-6Y C5,15-methyltransferase (decarboxylating) subunit CbiT [Hungatella hathewayi]